MALTPSNMEGGTERPAFCDNQTAAESPFQFAFAQSVGRLFRKSPVALANEVLSRLTSASQTHSSVCAAIDDFFWPKSIRNRQSLEESARRDLDPAVVLQPANCTERKPDDRQFGRSRRLTAVCR